MSTLSTPFFFSPSPSRSVALRVSRVFYFYFGFSALSTPFFSLRIHRVLRVSRVLLFYLGLSALATTFFFFWLFHLFFFRLSPVFLSLLFRYLGILLVSAVFSLFLPCSLGFDCHLFFFLAFLHWRCCPPPSIYIVTSFARFPLSLSPFSPLLLSPIHLHFIYFSFYSLSLIILSTAFFWAFPPYYCFFLCWRWRYCLCCHPSSVLSSVAIHHPSPLYFGLIRLIRRFAIVSSSVGVGVAVSVTILHPSYLLLPSITRRLFLLDLSALSAALPLSHSSFMFSPIRHRLSCLLSFRFSL